MTPVNNMCKKIFKIEDQIKRNLEKNFFLFKYFLKKTMNYKKFI